MAEEDKGVWWKQGLKCRCEENLIIASCTSGFMGREKKKKAKQSLSCYSLILCEPLGIKTMNNTSDVLFTVSSVCCKVSELETMLYYLRYSRKSSRLTRYLCAFRWHSTLNLIANIFCLNSPSGCISCSSSLINQQLPLRDFLFPMIWSEHLNKNSLSASPNSAWSC